jgi:hypothetical protein
MLTRLPPHPNNEVYASAVIQVRQLNCIGKFFRIR